jgi:predicted XRE-type DNA-binding protein
MTKRKRRTRARDFEVSRGNVYSDLGFPDSESMLVKAKLVTRIVELLEPRELTQSAAAELLGVSQPKLSNLLRGQFRGFSERKLMDFLTKLGNDVEIVVRSGARRGKRGSLSVVLAR